jgi:hypothetical protein
LVMPCQTRPVTITRLIVVDSVEQQGGG